MDTSDLHYWGLLNLVKMSKHAYIVLSHCKCVLLLFQNQGPMGKPTVDIPMLFPTTLLSIHPCQNASPPSDSGNHRVQVLGDIGSELSPRQPHLGQVAKRIQQVKQDQCVDNSDDP